MIRETTSDHALKKSLGRLIPYSKPRRCFMMLLIQPRHRLDRRFVWGVVVAQIECWLTGAYRTNPEPGGDTPVSAPALGSYYNQAVSVFFVQAVRG